MVVFKLFIVCGSHIKHSDSIYFLFHLCLPSVLATSRLKYKRKENLKENNLVMEAVV